MSVKTCSFASTCSSIIAVTYKRGSWTWTNDTTYTGGSSFATSSTAFLQ
jgi:hypothetical protein